MCQRVAGTLGAAARPVFCMAAQSLGTSRGWIGRVRPRRQRCRSPHSCTISIPRASPSSRALARPPPPNRERPASALAFLARTARVPRCGKRGHAQDRTARCVFFRNGFGVAPRGLASADDARRVDASLCPGIVKSARFGYDGKGQIRVGSRDEVAAAWIAMGEVPCVSEQLVPLAAEVSVVVARTGQGETSTWPVAENRLAADSRVSFVPARVPAALAEGAGVATATHEARLSRLRARRFRNTEGRIVVNEMPRGRTTAATTR